jgi:UDP-N-acetylglucosamine enolpyruvyl transferase
MMVTTSVTATITAMIRPAGATGTEIMANTVTFAALSPPIAEVCRFISFEALRARFEGAKDLLQF